MAGTRAFAFRGDNRRIVLSDSNLVAADAVTDSDFTEGIGRKADAAVLAESATASLLAYAKGILNAAGSVASVQTPDASVAAWTAAAHRLFTVTGEVLIKAVFGKVDEAITGARTAEVGVPGNPGGLIAQIANATLLNNVNDIWIGRTNSAAARYIGVLPKDSGVILSDIDIDLTIGGGTITNGQITFSVIWSPISSDGDVSAAVWD